MKDQRAAVHRTEAVVDAPPAWLLVMRHAKAADLPQRLGRRHVIPHSAPAAVLDPAGQSEASDIGGTLASVFEDLRRAGQPVQVARFIHENSRVAAATAEAVARAYEGRAAAIKEEHGERPPPLDDMVPIGREVSAQALDPTRWLNETADNLTAAVATRPGVQSAALIVGHDPGMSWLITHLLQKGRRGLRRRPDIPALARAELMAMRWNKNRWQPIWALTSASKEDIAAVTAKIRSKMDTAKVFGGFVTALLTFVVSQYATTQPSTAWWAALRGVSLAALGVAVMLYFLTLFWYDRLLMPTRFWASAHTHKHRKTIKVLLRPPSSAAWVLYQNMQRTWRLLFIPATYAAGIGVAAFAAARIEPTGATAAAVAVGVGVVAVSALWGWRSRPVLGVQD